MKYTICKPAIIAAFIAAMFFVTETRAQYDALFTQYMFNEMFINPAYTGSKDALSINAHHRQQWLGFTGRPITTTLTAHTPLFRNTMGIGLCLLNEKLGVLNRNIVYASYAYRIRLNEKSRLSFGLMGGMHLQSEKLASVKTVEPGDPDFSVNTPTVISPNFGFGMMYESKEFYAGFSIPRLIDDNIRIAGDGAVLKGGKVILSKFHYYLTAGKSFSAGINIRIVPQLMLKIVKNAPVQFDVSLNTLLKERMWLGLSYRSGADMSALAGLYCTPQLLLTYSYDYPLTRLHDFTSGSHEIGLSYNFSFRGRKVVSPRYFL